MENNRGLHRAARRRAGGAGVNHPPVWLYVVAVVLAVYRVTRLVAVDRFPLGALRRRLAVAGARQARQPLVEQPFRRPDGSLRIETIRIPPWWAELSVCSWCLSVSISAGYIAVAWAWPGPMWWVSLALAASTVTGLVAERTGV